MGAAAAPGCAWRCGADLVLQGCTDPAAARDGRGGRGGGGAPGPLAPVVQQCLGREAGSGVKYGEVDEYAGTSGQDHVFHFIKELPERLRGVASSALEEQMSEVHDLHIESAFRRTLERLEHDTARLYPPFELNWRLKTPPTPKPGANFTIASAVFPHFLNAWKSAGFRELISGRLAVVILLGGAEQKAGSGGAASEALSLLDVGLPSRKPVVQLLCERLVRVCRLAARSQEFANSTYYKQLKLQRMRKNARSVGASEGDVMDESPALCRVPLYVMVNSSNEAEVVGSFRKNRFFGLEERMVGFFVQDNTALVDRNGRILLASRHSIHLLPGGCGTLFGALAKDGALADMKARGVAQLHVLGGNNLLGKVADPLLVGFCRSMLAPIGCKLIERLGPDEDVGVFGNLERVTYKDQDGDGDLDQLQESKAVVIPSWEVLEEQRGRREKRRLYLWAADMCSYYFSLRAAERVAKAGLHNDLHLRELAVPCVSVRTGRTSAPEHSKAYKLESQIADCFPREATVHGLLVDRYAEWARVRTPQDVLPALAALSALHEAWLRAAGGRFVTAGSAGFGEDERCEVSPLVSYDGEGLDGVFPGGGRDAGDAPRSRAGAAKWVRDLDLVQAIRLPLSLLAADEEPAESMCRLGSHGSAAGRANLMYAPKSAHEPGSGGWLDLTRVGPEFQFRSDAADQAAVSVAEASQRLCETPPELRRQEDKWEDDLERRVAALRARQIEDEEALARKMGVSPRDRKGSPRTAGSPKTRGSGSPREGGASPRSSRARK